MSSRVGYGVYTFEEIISSLKNCKVFTHFYEKFSAIARDLELDLITVAQIRRDMHLDKMQLEEACNDLLMRWVSNKGKDAVLEKLIKVLVENGLRYCADAIQKNGSGAEKVESSNGQLAVISSSENSITAKEKYYLHSICLGHSDMDGCLAMLTHFIEIYNLNGAHQLSAKNDNGVTFLHLFVKKKGLTPQHLHDFSQLLVTKQRALLFNERDSSKNSTPFQWTLEALEPKKETLDLLYTSGVDFEVIDKDGYSSLAYAVRGGRKAEFIIYLIEHFKADWKYTIHNRNLLHIACDHGNLDVSKLFTDEARGYCLNNLKTRELQSSSLSITTREMESSRSDSCLI